MHFKKHAKVEVSWVIYLFIYIYLVTLFVKMLQMLSITITCVISQVFDIHTCHRKVNNFIQLTRFRSLCRKNVFSTQFINSDENFHRKAFSLLRLKKSREIYDGFTVIRCLYNCARCATKKISTATWNFTELLSSSRNWNVLCGSLKVCVREVFRSLLL